MRTMLCNGRDKKGREDMDRAGGESGETGGQTDSRRDKDRVGILMNLSHASLLCRFLSESRIYMERSM